MPNLAVNIQLHLRSILPCRLIRYSDQPRKVTPAGSRHVKRADLVEVCIGSNLVPMLPLCRMECRRTRL